MKNGILCHDYINGSIYCRTIKLEVLSSSEILSVHIELDQVQLKNTRCYATEVLHFMLEIDHDIFYFHKVYKVWGDIPTYCGKLKKQYLQSHIFFHVHLHSL